MRLPMATVSGHTMNVDEWAALPEDDDRELVDGEVFALRNDLYALVVAASEGTLAIPDHDGLVINLDELFARLD